MPETMTVHHLDCPYEYAWDVAGEAGAGCICGGTKRPFYPRRECTKCWRVLKLCQCDPSRKGAKTR